MEDDNQSLLAAEELRLLRDDVLKKFDMIDWDSFKRTFLSDSEVSLLRRAEHHPLEQVFTNDDEGQEYVAILVKCLQNATSEAKVLDYVTTKMEDVLSSETSKRAQFFLCGKEKMDSAPFMRLVRGPDSVYQQRTATIVLAHLLTECPSDPYILLEWILEALTEGKGRSAVMRIAVQALSILLKDTKVRLLFGEKEGVFYLSKLLRQQGGEANAQLLYEITFSLWTLSLVGSLQASFLDSRTIPALVDQVTAAPREKVVRMALATLRLLAQSEDRQFVEEMTYCGLMKTLRNLRQRQWADPDIGDDVEVLYNKLMQDYHELSSFMVYAQEVKSGSLKWGVCHTEKFWKENVREMEADDFKLLKALVALLNSKDELVIAIACYDIGEFVRFYPNGKHIVKHIGAKDTIMDLVEHQNAEVQRHALQCISKLMVNKWEFVK